MTERITPEQINTALEKSRLFEHAWRVFSHRLDYSEGEFDAATKFILDSRENYETVISCPPDPDGWGFEDLDKIFAGLFHTNIRYPQNFTERNFKEN